MTNLPVSIDAEVGLELFEMLGFLVDLCDSQGSATTAVLSGFTWTDYSAEDLREDCVRLAGQLWKAMGGELAEVMQ